ncbi:MAG: hypothetical protein IJT15_02675 [Rickettsiales bacterium]|nr:hypothetical protein [Rickettsiales bacterium]
MNDEEIARNKVSMQITDGQLVSWGTVKGTVLNYINRCLASATPNTKYILSKLENEYSLSGKNQSDLFQYRNSVSGIINKISGKAQDWPSSSVFSYTKGNKVVLITLAGVFEYDKSDVIRTPAGQAYVKNAKAHFFNGIEANVSICPSVVSDDNDNEEVNLTYEQLEDGDFTCDDIRLFPSIPANTHIEDIKDIKKLKTYELFRKVQDRLEKYHLSVRTTNGISISNLDDNNIFDGSLSCCNNNMSNNNNTAICHGTFANLMPYDKVTFEYKDIDGEPNSQLFNADGVGGIYTDNLSSVNRDYIVNNFVNIMSTANSIDDSRISEISKRFGSQLRIYHQTNIGENNNDDETGDRFNVITNSQTNEDGDYYKTKILLNGKYVEQIIKYDDEGNYLIANKDLNASVSDGIYEAQLGNGNLFIGRLKVDEGTGNVYFMEGKFFNQEGKVIDNKKQLSLQEASSLLFNDARSVNNNDLREFKDSNRILIEKGENRFDFTTIGASFENTMKNDRIYSDYLPTSTYIQKQIDNVELFLKSEMEVLNTTPEKTYEKYIERRNKRGFSNQLIKDIRRATKELCKKTRENTYVLSDGEKLTKDRLGAFYSQLSQWQYLHRMKAKRQALDGDDIQNHEQLNEETSNDESNSKIDPASPLEKSQLLEEKNNVKNDNDKEDIKDKKNSNTHKDNENRIEDPTIPTTANKNLLQQSQNDDNISETRYPQILNHDDLKAILTDTEANQIASESPENQAIFSNIMTNVVNNEDDKISLFIKTCQLIHESRGKIREKGAKILPLSRDEYEIFITLKNRLTNSIINARNKKLCKQVQSYQIEINDEQCGIKDDFNKAMQFASSGEEQLNTATHIKNCKLFDELDKTGEIKQLCSDIMFERDVSGNNINENYSEYYDEYESRDSFNNRSTLNIDNSTKYPSNNNII